jgi:lysophospholipase L1-like esterase
MRPRLWLALGLAGLALGAPVAAAGARSGWTDDQLRASMTQTGAELSRHGLLVVAVGDSVASGEGNPDVASKLHAQWQSAQCHRSSLAAPAVAARLFAEATPARPVTLVSTACSGATIRQGLLDSYEGIDKRLGAPLPPQIEVLKLLAHEHPIDALIVSIGANDLKFGDVVKQCAAQAWAWLSCFKWKRLFGASRGETLPEVLSARLGELRADYRALADALAPLVKRVFLVQYFDPTRGADGITCNRILHIKGGILDKARELVIDPLNEEGAAIAKDAGWHYVDGIQAAFGGHGYCTGSDSWIVSARQSVLRLGGGARIAGTLHPNALGAEAIGERIFDSLAQALPVATPAPTPTPEPTPALEPDKSKPVAAGWGVGTGLADVLLAGGLGALYLGRRRLTSSKPPASLEP